MKTSTEIASIAKVVGMERAVEYCAKAGFDAWDFSMGEMCKLDWNTMRPVPVQNELNGPNYLAFARKLKQIGLDNGIVCNQSHAPYPVFVPEIRGFLKRAIECSAEAGAEICVIHPYNVRSAEENAELYGELLPFAKSCGVKIATENMWLWDDEKDESIFSACATAEDFIKHIDIMQDDFMVGCLDLGHAEMRGAGDGAVKMIRAMGSRIQALHIHDNDRWHDSHQIPLSMDIDFSEILKALKEINYQGYFTLEAYNFMKAYTPDNAFDGVVKLSQSARTLANQYEALYK